MAYRIVRFFFKGRPRRVIKSGLTLAQAQEWCGRKETSASTCTTKRMLDYTRVNGLWFDGYEEMK